MNISTNTSKALGIRERLMLGFAAVLLVFLILVLATLYIVYDTKKFSTTVVQSILPTYDALLDINNDLHQSQALVQQFLLTGDDKLKTTMEAINSRIDNEEATLDNLQKNWSNNAYDKRWQDIKLTLAKIRDSEEKILALAATDKTGAISLMQNEYSPLLAKSIALLNVNNADTQTAHGLLDIQNAELHAGTKTILGNLTLLQWVEIVSFILCIILSIIIASITSRSILHHINMFRSFSSRIAAGDLTQYIKIETNDEIGQLGDDLNKMTEGLATITKQITEACQNMLSSVEEVRHAIESQSSGSAEQASSINQITASLSEIEKSSSQTMEKAQTLGELAERTRETGQSGLEAVEQSIHGMKGVKTKVELIAKTILDLSHQTQQVGEITAAVNNLAQQSKMLALNASIEAAKAGDAGKGFAVVAVEVKNLAEQSEQSTAQVQKILEEIRHATEKAVMVTEEGTKGVDHGTSLVEQTGAVIRNLNDVIHETTIASQQIQAAIRQEGSGIEQITIGMNEINQVTSTFVESARQTKEAITNLAEIAKNLKTHIDSYKV